MHVTEPLNCSLIMFSVVGSVLFTHEALKIIQRLLFPSVRSRIKPFVFKDLNWSTNGEETQIGVY